MTEPRFRTCHAKAEDALPLLPDESVDSLVCDPPSGISFMGKEWDSDKGGRDPWVVWLTGVMEEAYRVMKPGAYGLVWALPRTSYWTAWALDDAGFEIEDYIQHVFATGFPKSHNVGKAIDAIMGAERPVIGYGNHAVPKMAPGHGVSGLRQSGSFAGDYAGERVVLPVTAPATPEAAQWEGWGTQLKPACEFWILVRKPHKGTIAANVLKHGVGALNIDACRIGRAADDVPGWHQSGAKGSEGFLGEGFKIRDRDVEDIQSRCGNKGRWPSHLVLSHDERCVPVGTRRVKGCPATVVQGGKDGGGYDPGSGDGTRRGEFQGYGDAEGMEEIEEYACVPGCPVRLLDAQGGARKSGKMKAGTKRKNRDGFNGPMPEETGAETYGDEGAISRFFYTPKPSKRERDCGLDHLEWIEIEVVGWGNEVPKVRLLVDTVSSLPRVIDASMTDDLLVSEWSTMLFGNGTSGPSLLGCKFTIATRTNSTIESGILDWLMRSLTSASTRDVSCEMVCGGSLAESVATSTPSITITVHTDTPIPGVGVVSAGTSLRITRGSGHKNRHPTLKSVALMRYLIRLITPPGGVVLDCFAGSGTTGVAALQEGFRFLGVEQEERSHAIARARLEWAAKEIRSQE